jgi:hypothetical protein
MCVMSEPKKMLRLCSVTLCTLELEGDRSTRPIVVRLDLGIYLNLMCLLISLKASC